MLGVLPALDTLNSLIMLGFGAGFFVVFFSWGITAVLRWFFRILGL